MLRTFYAKSELVERMQEYIDVFETFKFDFEAKEEGLDGATNRQLRIAEGFCASRVGFRFQQAANSRAIRARTINIPLGLGTPDLKFGDRVYAIIGCSVALILRIVSTYHRVIGNSRVFGFLNSITLQNLRGVVPPSVVEEITLR